MKRIKAVILLLTIIFSSFFAPLVSISSFASVVEKENSPSFAPPGANYVQFENIRRYGSPRGMGAWRQGPRVTAPSTSGTISKVIMIEIGRASCRERV